MKQTSSLATFVGRWRLIEHVRSLTHVLARARRRARPGPGSDGLPFAALRVPCGARPSGPSHNSLRSLRSLRSNRCDESDDEARQMRARPEDLRSSAAPIRPAQAPPAAWPATRAAFDLRHPTTGSTTRHPGSAWRASEAPSRTGFGARARSALRDLTRCVCLTTVSAANEGSYATGPRARAGEGSRSEAKTASAARQALPGCRAAAPRPAKQEFDVSNGPNADRPGMRAFQASRVTHSGVGP